MRNFCLDPKKLVLALLGCALLSGCGGGKSFGEGEVSGVIFDANGDVVRGARVFYDSDDSRDRTTTSNTSGLYVLEGVSADDVTIRAEIRVNNVLYRGSNVVRVFEGERTKNMNITLYRESLHGEIRGTVRDQQGRLLRGARVFARPDDGTIFSSAYSITNEEGVYEIGGLLGGVTFEVTANAAGYNATTFNVIVTAGETETANFTIGNGTDPLLPAPGNLGAQAYTSPYEATRSARYRRALDSVKAELDPKGRVRKTVTRDTINGNPIEVDLYWDRVNSAALLGYGIYRAVGNGNFEAVEFARDPLAEFFADADSRLIEGRTYRYALTSLNTRYPDTGNSESDFSNVATVDTLGDLNLGSVNAGPTFNWSAAVGATKYAVFIYSTYPDLGVSSLFNNFDNPVSGTSFTYGGTLQSGRTYYYLIVGRNDDDSGRTISDVGSFVAN